MKIATVDDIKRLDNEASTKYGISRLLLMENAAMAIKNVVEHEFGVSGLKILVVAGPGNNGGDGLAAARQLHSCGADTTICILTDEDKFKGEAKKNLEIVKNIGLPIHRITEASDLNPYLLDSDLVIDAIFGTGLNRDVRGIYADAIDAINDSYVPVLSVDIPSGINGDNGQVMGTAIYADYTVTFGLPKPGHFIYPGAEHVGKLYISHISYPRALIEDDELNIELNTPTLIPPRYGDTHKGDYGRCLFIAGSKIYMGAPYLAAYSFLVTGGGMSYLSTVDSISRYIAVKGGEIILIPLKETSEGYISSENIDTIMDHAERMDFIVIGPGLGLSEDTEKITIEIVKNVDKPILVDGDGLTHISKYLEILNGREAPTILTPHPGEMSRLTQLDIPTIKKDKINIVKRFCMRYGVYLALKGANTIIGYPNGKIFINTSGNPGMATAGTGDVLAGMIPALYCQGLDIGDALRTGVFLHGVAGDIAAQKYGLEGVTASRVMRNINNAIKFLEEKYSEIIDTCYYSIYRI